MRSGNPVGPGVGDLGTLGDGGVPGNLGESAPGDQDDYFLDLVKTRQAVESLIEGIDNFLANRRSPIPEGAARVTPTQYIKMIRVLLQELKQ